MKTKIGPLQSGRSLESGPKEMAEILSAQYESVFSSPLEDLPTANMANQTYQALVDIDITEELVREAVENMDENSAPGPDGITAYFLKTYIDQLLYPIIRMWRNSLDTGKLPEGIAIAWITPIYKGGNKSLPANYRPVALTNHVTKIFERVLKKEVVLHLERNDLLNASQHGFTSGRSTISQILNYYNTEEIFWRRLKMVVW